MKLKVSKVQVLLATALAFTLIVPQTMIAVGTGENPSFTKDITNGKQKTVNNYIEEQRKKNKTTDGMTGGINITSTDIRFLKQLDGSKEDNKKRGEQKYKEAIYLLADYAKENDLKVKIDLDDLGFQTYVKRMATKFDTFSDVQMKKVIEFIKFMDLYENFSQNEKIKKYKSAIESGETLSHEEAIDLYSLMPLENNSTEYNESDIINHESEEVTTLSTYPYSRTKAKDYAYKWYNSRNPDYDYYARYNGCDIYGPDCWDRWNDCTNFVSQALYAGGMVTWRNWSGDYNWFYDDYRPTHSWGGAHNFYRHWRYRADLAPKDTDLAVGDAVNADFSGDGHIDHTAIVTAHTSAGRPLVTQHTDDKKDSPLSRWFDAGYTVYGWEMDNANYFEP